MSADLANLRAQLEEQKRITLELEFGKGVVVSLDLTKEIRRAEKEKFSFYRQLRFSQKGVKFGRMASVAQFGATGPRLAGPGTACSIALRTAPTHPRGAGEARPGVGVSADVTALYTVKDCSSTPPSNRVVVLWSDW